MNRIVKYVLTTVPAVLLIAGCSTTKRLADGDVLYSGMKKIKIESTVGDDVPSSVESAVKEPLSVKPNNPLFSPYVRTPLPTGLWAWNYLYTENKGGLKKWLYGRLAKEPVLISKVQPELRVRMVEDILDNHGYFGSSASYELHYRKNPKKARISYKVDVAEPWTYSYVAFPKATSQVTAMIDTMQRSSNIVPGARYNVDTLTNERIRITNFLRNESYYYFRPDYIEYLADTLAQPLKVDLRMVMAKGIPPAALRPYRVGEVTLEVYNPEAGEPDSLYCKNLKIRYQKPLRVKPKVLEQLIHITPGEPSNVSDINKTLNNLTRLGVFRYANMSVTPLDSLRGQDSLNMTISASMDTPLEAELEVDFSSKSSSFIGPGVIFSVRNKNIFHGGEVLSVKVNGSYEWQTGNRSEEANATAVNSYEVGLNSSLTFPRLLAPGFLRGERDYGPRTTFQLGASVMNRPKFFTMAQFNASMEYDWSSSPQSTHNLTIFKLVYNKLLRTTDNFDSVMVSNPFIAMSFNDQFIPSASYTYTLDRRYGRRRLNRVIWQSTAMSAGNIFAGVYELFGVKGIKKILNNEFAQFVKGTSEVRSYYQLGEKMVLASRLSLGMGYAYGNSKVLPYSEQFYAGGANSIRAFTVRSIGPGSYRPDASKLYGYFDQVGDIKIEANVELRFDIIAGLNGAVFLDAANIWLRKDDPTRPGGTLRFKSMWKELATGTGVGLRYDISILVIRADLGIGIHTPYDNPDKSGYYNISEFKDGLGFHLAIGYPF